MSGERRMRILEQLVATGLDSLTPERLGVVCRDATGVTGASLMLMTGGQPRGPVAATDAVSELIEELQQTLGEGPCVDAYELGWPVLEPDLAQPTERRWLAFSEPAVAAGVRAIYGFPLSVGALRLGALDLYNDRPGPLSDDQHADALIVADVAAVTLISLHTDAAGHATLDQGDGASLQHVIHQASGMVSAQLDVTVGDALVRLRAHAFAEGRALRDVAADVVARRLRFTDQDAT
jgi:hypothetical protein